MDHSMGAYEELLDSAIRPMEDDVRRSLQALLQSPDLKLSARNRRFLSYVVLETLAGRADRIKAYTIGVDVFGRPADFDPAVDPIVRIEATRLRAALSAYYEGRGAEDPLRMAIPPGSYTPTFERRRPAVRLAATRTAEPFRDRDSLGPAIVIDCGADLSVSLAAPPAVCLINGIAQRLKATGIRVFVKPTPDRRAAVNAMREMFDRPQSAYALDLRFYPGADGWRCSWSLMDLRNGEILGARASFLDGDEKVEDLARDTATSVGALMMLELYAERRTRRVTRL
jgi:SAM-dependent methyltransferase